MIAVIVSSLAITAFVIIYFKIEEDRLERIEREKIFQKWMFDSLYSISSKVLLPTEYKKETSNKSAVVYSPEEDPMAEFSGHKDDFYGK